MSDDVSRTTPLGMTRYSYEFFEAALAVDSSVGRGEGFEVIAPTPALYLIGHSIELSFKAYLLHRGVELATLKKIGHNLHKCIRKARELGLNQHVSFSKQEEDAFRILDTLYSTKQLEYIVTGAKQFPSFGLVEMFGAKLFNAVAEQTGFRKRFDQFIALDSEINGKSTGTKSIQKEAIA